MGKKSCVINLSEEHLEFLRVIVNTGLVKDTDSAIAESLELFKNLLCKYFQILDYNVCAMSSDIESEGERE